MTPAIVSVEDAPSELPEQPVIATVFPNPTRAGVTLQIELSEPEYTELTIHDLTGRKIASLMDQSLSAGQHQIRWDAEGLPSGLYMARLTVGTTVDSKPITLIR